MTLLIFKYNQGIWNEKILHKHHFIPRQSIYLLMRANIKQMVSFLIGSV